MLKNIAVRQNLIDRGDRDSPCDCPVYMAFREVIALWYSVYVASVSDDCIALLIHSEDLTVGWKKYDWPATDFFAPLPVDVQTKILKFDRTGEMKPFEFEFEIPDKFLKE